MKNHLELVNSKTINTPPPPRKKRAWKNGRKLMLPRKKRKKILLEMRNKSQDAQGKIDANKI